MAWLWPAPVSVRPVAGRLAALQPAHLVAGLPVLALAAQRGFGDWGLVALAVLGPVAAYAMQSSRAEAAAAAVPDHPRARIELALDHALARPGQTAACLVIHVDDMVRFTEQLGPRASEGISDAILQRLGRAVRDADRLERLDSGNFAVALAPAARFDLEGLLQIAARLQVSVLDPIEVDATTVRISLSVGFAMADRLADPTGPALLVAAEAAMLEARAAGAGSIRAHSAELQHRRDTRAALAGDVRHALETGQIRAWFQPQICTDTGKVSGFEALARWQHPTRGLVPPGEFLPAIEAAGRMEQLGQVMLAQSLAALSTWDRAGHDVDSVAVNLSAAELRDPSLPNRLAWEIDRHDLTPDRLTVEVLESVISDAPDDIISRNIAALAELGCGIDLDDFGTGHASITSIRRFAVSRIKIDRSFVSRLDTDREQQRMVAAILTMCERLDLAAVAEGVETPGEHTILAQLGCGHVQGFGIARPMPFDETLAWLDRHRASLTAPPDVCRRTG
jgi:EAL domain-containing protein (putative c-di-GMP-specific phosphodiesterase class I)/GGDEF domain-containing protein